MYVCVHVWMNVGMHGCMCRCASVLACAGVCVVYVCVTDRKRKRQRVKITTKQSPLSAVSIVAVDPP